MLPCLLACLSGWHTLNAMSAILFDLRGNKGMRSHLYQLLSEVKTVEILKFKKYFFFKKKYEILDFEY